MFARAFRTGLQPVEIGRRIIKAIDAGQTVDTRGEINAPNHFVVRLAPDDYARFAPMASSLRAELIALVRDHTNELELGLLGRVGVDLVDDPDRRTGMVKVDASFRDGAPPDDSPAHLELADGTIVTLGDQPVRIGRMTDCDVVLADPDVSRYHAELHPSGDSYLLVDLGSTNGVQVGDRPIARRLLLDGDEIRIGPARLRYSIG